MFIHFGIVTCLVILGSNGQVPSEGSSSGFIFPSEEECSAPGGIMGECVPLNNCSSIMNLLTHLANSPSTDKSILTNSICGFVGITPQVCCPLTFLIAPTPPPIPSPPDVRNHEKLGLVNSEICGPITQVKITLGKKTMVSEFPWMALLGYRINGNGIDYRCGGTVINKRYVLTAAHCVRGLSSNVVLAEVRLGEHDLSKEQDCDDEEEGIPITCADRYQDFLIERVHTHNNYPAPGYGNDIALIRLNRDADFASSNVKPICLPVGNSGMLRSKKAVVTGWGRTELGMPSQDLLKIKVPIVSNDECSRVFGRIGVPIGYKQLCAGGEGHKDSCAGDSGGPLQYPGNVDGDMKYIQHGIISFGMRSCGTPGYPGVYTRVTYYMDWILDTITE